MRTFLLVVILVLVPGFADARPRTSETVMLKIQKEKYLPKSRLRIKFLSVIEDSRCPTDTRCVWEGNARISARVSKNGHTRTIELNTRGQNNAVIVDGYSIKLVRLAPEPRSNIRINRNGYRGTLEVEKLAS